MAQFEKLKNQARREEQRGRWVEAIDLYKQAIRFEEDSRGTSVDFGLYNRVGDLYLRLGQTATAVEYYETAVDSYAGHEMHTSAIALCNKILRIAPDHPEIYRKLGHLHAQTGLFAEARNSFLEYAARMLAAGQLADALEAMQEIVDLSKDEEIRCAFAEILFESGRTVEAVAQLRLVWRSRVERGSDADEIRSRILEMDPTAHPEDESPDPEEGEPAPDAETASPAPALEIAAASDSPSIPAPGVAAQLDPAPPLVDVPSRKAGLLDLGELIREGLATEPEGEVDLSSGLRAAEKPLARLPDPGPDLRVVIDRFRKQVSGVVEDSDASVHYDLGMAFHGMGLLDEAIAEFQIAIQGSTHVRAAHEMLGRCLSAQEIAKAEPSVAANAQGNDGDPVADELQVSEITGIAEVPALEYDEQLDDLLAEAVKALDSTMLDSAAEASPADSNEGEAGSDLTSLLFEARLAQYRARQAEDQHETDYQAHFDLGEAYREMSLFEEAVTEFKVACVGPKSVSNRTLDVLEQMAADTAVPERIRLHVLQIFPQVGRSKQAIRGYRSLLEERRAAGKSVEDLITLIGSVVPSQVSAQAAETTVGGPAAKSMDGVLKRLAADLLPELDVILDELQAQPQAMEEDPGDGDSVAPTVDAAMEPACASEAEPIILEARRAAEAGESAAAVVQLQAALRDFEAKRQIHEAAEVLDELLGLTPDDVVLHHRRAELAIMANDRTGLVSAYFDLGQSLQRQKASRSARSVYGRILDIEPKNEAALAAIAEIDDTELAREKIRRQRSGPAGARSRAGRSSEREGPGSDSERVTEFDEMLGDLRAATELPLADDYEGHFEIGLSHMRARRYEEAIQAFQIAIPGQPNPLAAYNKLGECFLASGQPRLAVKALTPALELESFSDMEKLGILYLMGVAWIREGDKRLAVEYLERVCAADVKYRDAAAQLAALADVAL